MSSTDSTARLLVSIIITTYNHGHYLDAAIGSAVSQDYPFKEIIVVDDGSTDNTRDIVKKIPEARYVHQPNAGLAAARNTGVDQSKGDCLIFLDADDILLPGAVSRQAALMDRHPECAFVSGGHFTSNEHLEERKEVSSEVCGDYYKNLLRRNYIGMHAAVIYRREAFDHLRFDTRLRAGEDYDFYLRVAAEAPVHNHREPIAVYRGHAENMSANATLMLESTLQALRGQKERLRNNEEKAAWRHGIRNWIDYYSYYTYGRLKSRRSAAERTAALRLLWKYKPKLLVRHYLRQISTLLKLS